MMAVGLESALIQRTKRGSGSGTGSYSYTFIGLDFSESESGSGSEPEYRSLRAAREAFAATALEMSIEDARRRSGRGISTYKARRMRKAIVMAQALEQPQVRFTPSVFARAYDREYAVSWAFSRELTGSEIAAWQTPQWLNVSSAVRRRVREKYGI